MTTRRQNRLTGSHRHRVAPDTGPMTSSSNDQQPSTIRGEAHHHDPRSDDVDDLDHVDDDLAGGGARAPGQLGKVGQRGLGGAVLGHRPGAARPCLTRAPASGTPSTSAPATGTPATGTPPDVADAGRSVTGLEPSSAQRAPSIVRGSATCSPATARTRGRTRRR